MLNRIYIIVGLIAILALGSAFIVPRFIQWGDYRERMEELASGVLGAEVTIRGDIEFSLLPQPRLTFTDVLVGSPDEPAATVDAVEADFSLMDFLRDNYHVTKLVLREPVVDFTIDDSGFLTSGINVTGEGGGVALMQANIIDATFRIIDERSGANYVASAVDGDLKLASFSGPFQFQGSGTYGGERYGVRFNSAAANITGNARVTLGLRPESGAYSLTAEGQLEAGMAPKFDGTLTYRQTPPVAASASDVRGDLVFTSKVTSSTDRVLLSGYTLQPDENRSGARLTGSASIQIGAAPSFDAVISGGVIALPPRDAQEDTSTQPYEVLRLLAELPAPPVPPIPGKVSIDLAEVGLRAFSIRNVVVSATTDAESWQVDTLQGQLPGNTQVRATGSLDNEAGRPAFRGSVSLNSERLDSLAALWRKPSEDNPLFNMPGGLDGKVMLVGDALGLTAGRLTLDGKSHAVELRLGFGDETRLDVVGHFDVLSTIESAALGALLPNISNDPAFGRSFPTGSFSLTANRARAFGQDGTELVAEGRWTQDKIAFSRLSAAQWGGARINGALELGGTLAEPELSGTGRVAVSSASAPALALLYGVLQTPESWRGALAPSLPADLSIDLEAPNDQGGQILSVGGTLGVSDFNLRAELSAGIGGLLTEPLRLNGALESMDVAGLTQQVGLGNAELFSGDGSMLVSFAVEGSPTNSLDSHLNASLGTERVGFTGNLLMTATGEIQGTGTLDVSLGDAGTMAEVVGSQGLSLPLAVGSGTLHFEGERLARLTDIKGKSGEVGFGGELALSRTGSTAAVSGAVTIDTVSVEGLAATLFGRAALVGAIDVWPEGPIDAASEPRVTRGTVSVTAPVVTAGGVERMQNATFDLAWDETRLRLSRFEASVGGGKATFDVAVCCEGPLAQKNISGRMSLVGVPVDAVATPAVANALSGALDGGMRFEASGASIAEAMGSLTGEGSFTLKDFAVAGLSPGVYPTVAGLGDVLNMDSDALRAIVSLALGQGSFSAPTATGTFTIAGGVARLANFIVEGNGGRLAGNLNLALKSLGLDGSFVLTPLGFTDERGLVGEDTARILTRIKGTLTAPAITPDLEELVGAVQVRANELEVDRLEVLRAEDAERQRAAAEERNKLIEEQRRKAAAEEAARLAIEEAARKAAEEEALRQQQQQPVAPPQVAPPVQPLQLNLGYQPMVNQPVN
ncbi:hypothetical protein WH87_16185 [Devosia epidermidihirudinis]|uniref:AsmA domain-containing protein n=1 Tax=Devosia epidermidihirudinis TaxID=1293439 RepID=A0A0F5Q3W6_9HYPH|nr:AsmA-like C-terminal region-containing protein [Devosia epidermidihirudinis]KKC35587.1 hypothetical protein WH87_16185 [Devosia epidermidihirudinis]